MKSLLQNSSFANGSEDFTISRNAIFSYPLSIHQINNTLFFDRKENKQVKQTVLITGGAGFIGSHVNQMLCQKGFPTIVLDNLSQGKREAVPSGIFVEGDLMDRPLLKKIFSSYSIDAVMHFAASIDVGESVRQPALYYHNNVANTLNLLETMIEHGTKTFVFSSTAAIFGIPQTETISELHPCNPINPYGESKYMVEKILKDFDDAYGLKFCALRYFNAAGGDPSGKLKNFKSHETHLIPLILKSLEDPTKKVTIHGTDYPTRDGTCIRDYVHIWDLGSAHILGMEKLFQQRESCSYNLGNGQGYSVREVIAAAEKVTKHKVSFSEGPRRAGDPPFLVADATKAHIEMGWQPLYSDLETILLHAWQGLDNPRII